MNTPQSQLITEAKRRLIAAHLHWVKAAEASADLHWSQAQNEKMHTETAVNTVEYAVKLMETAGLDPATIASTLTKAGIRREHRSL